jgi:hypothetical protein
LDYSKFTYNERQFENFVKSGNHLSHIDFESDSFDTKFKAMLKMDHMKEYYSSVSFVVPKYGIDELHQLYKKYGQFKSFELLTE